MEVLASSGEGNPGLHCFDGSSGVKQWYAETPYAIDAGVAVGDLEGDGEKEIVICDLGGWVFCLGGKRGENEPIFSLDGKGQEKWRFKLGAGADASPTLADTDGDGKQEVLIGSSDRYVYCLDHDGRLVWKLRTDMKVNTSPAVADLEDDGHVEILIGSRDTKLYCLQASGKGPASWPMKRGGPASTASIE